MRSNTSPWNDETVERLKELTTTRELSATQIANALGGGLSRNAVIGKCGRMGIGLREHKAAAAASMSRHLNAPAWSDQEDVILKQAWGDGASFEDLCELLPNRSFYAIQSRRQLLKLPSRVHHGAHRRLFATPEPDVCGPLRDFPARNQCRWIHGDVQRDPWRCCGAPAVDGSSWCAHHGARIYRGSQEATTDRAVSTRSRLDAGTNFRAA